MVILFFFFFQAEDGIRDLYVTGVQTCALPILLATRSGSGEVLHARLRKGQAGSGRGALRFVQELIARVRRAGACGEILVRADSAFWNKRVMAYLAERGCRYSIGVTMHKVVA